VWRGEPGAKEPVIRSGVTAIWPHGGDVFRERLYAAISLFNGYGEITGRSVIDEWGLLGSPIVLTDTVHVGAGYDAVVRYMTERDPEVGTSDVEIPVVAETDDGYLSDNRSPAITREDFYAALESAREGLVEEGCIGAGTGTHQFQFKGGIGTSSRVVEIAGERFHVGVLLQTNYGRRPQLVIKGVPVGRRITDLMPPRESDGSCIGVLATDLPLVPHQLRRLARRIDVGMARTGSVANDGSGEIFIAFSTANRVPRAIERAALEIRVMVEGQFSSTAFNQAFEGVAEATEEAAVNALFQADTVYGRDGHVLYGLPIERVLEMIR
jgi:D-aminopeptidase